MNAAEIATALGKAKQGSNGWWTCRCPCHDDKDPSLGLKDGDKSILVKCHAGCPRESVIAALRGLGLWPEKAARPAEIVPNYIYKLEDGTRYLGVVRYQKKDGSKGYAQAHWDAQKREWVKGAPKGTRVPYRLPDLKKADEVFVVEGEKCADHLLKIGLFATTSSGGAGKWTSDLNRWFEGKAVWILPDADEPGRKHADDVARNLNGVAREVRIVTLPNLGDGEDVADWIGRGGTKDDLMVLVANAPIWSAAETPPGEEDQGWGLAADRRIDELARLDTIAYEHARTAAAKELGVRASILDREVALRREANNQAHGDPDFPPVKPWDEPVSGEDLLAELCDTFERHIVYSSKHASLASALWVLHAHAFDAWQHSPILFVNSPTKRCGKTNKLILTGELVPKPLPSANCTPATIFRAIALWGPTLLIDEADTFISDKSELRGVLNSGHTRAQAFVLRCVGDDLVPTKFSTWAPKAFGAIGRIHPTLEDRSITIELKRKLKSERVERIPRDANAYDELRRKCARWAKDNLEALKLAEPELPEVLNDRARDNWFSLTAIAEACGGDWPKAARLAAEKLSGIDDDETPNILLLEDLKLLFDEAEDASGEPTNLASKDIVTSLVEMEDRVWPEFSRGHPITTRGVAKLLKPFKIYPRQVLVGGSRVQGYRPDQFRYVFRRYLSPETLNSKEDQGLKGDDIPITPETEAEDKTTANGLKDKGIKGFRGYRATGESETGRSKSRRRQTSE